MSYTVYVVRTRIGVDQYLPCPYVSRAPIQILACGGRRKGTKHGGPGPTRVEYSLPPYTPRLLPGRAGESVKRSGISSLHPHPGRPSHAHVACAVCPQLLSCPSTARYVPVRSAAPPARTGLSQAPACPATAHMHGVVSCTHAAVQFLTSSFTSHPFQNLKRYPQENSNRTTSH